MESPDALLGLAEAAEELGVSHSTLRAQVHRGRLRAMKVGRDWLVTSSEVARYRAEVQKRQGTSEDAPDGPASV